LLSGTLAAASAAYDMTSCKILTAMVVLGAATTPASYQIQVSHDSVNWSNVGVSTAAVASAATTFSAINIAARFARVICSAGATAQTGTYVALSGCN